MKMNPNTHYTPTENGFSISGSSELFNRLLYGSHKNDDKESKYATIASDVPLFMGAATDWSVYDWCLHGKRGTLFSGLCVTPGQRVGGSTESSESGAKWFHKSNDVLCEFKNGWMEYQLSDTESHFPDVWVNIEAYPLLPDDGFLVHYKIKVDQRVVLTLAFGGITDYIGYFLKGDKDAHFHASDCEKNIIEIGKNRACVRHPNGSSMHIGTSFESKIEIGSAKVLETNSSAALFLGSEPENSDDQVLKITSPIDQGTVLDGYFVAIHNSDDASLEKWLTMENPVDYIKNQIYQKHICVDISSPENELNQTITPNVIALDSSFHRNSFHHGSFEYHSPFLGWRGWYGASILGWNDKVNAVMSAHLDQMVKKSDGEEKVWFDGKGAREGDPNDPSPYHNLENSYGYLPYFLGLTLPYYNMQECGFDMMLYHIEWSGNLNIAGKYFDDMAELLNWEERIFDPDSDGLYQNFLNTWISDGHSYNGAGCAQASAYNYRANAIMAKIGKKLGKNVDVFEKRAKKIKKAMNEKLWLSDIGVMAESVDTVGNCLIHPSPELSTTYLCIDCDVADDFQAYTMLRFGETQLKSIETPGRGGRLFYSSNWYPKKYSTCGIYPSENAHLAITYFKLGLKEMGKKIIDALVDCNYTGRNPGMIRHVQSAMGIGAGSVDFTDVTSMYLRAVVEGLYGIRINALDNTIIIAPGFPETWDSASLSLKDISLNYHKRGNQEIFEVFSEREEKKVFRIPMISTKIDAVFIDGEITDYTIKATPAGSFVMVETEKTGRLQLRIVHGKGEIPTLKYAKEVLSGNEIAFSVTCGEIIEYYDISNTLENIEITGNKIYAKDKTSEGFHTFFIRVKSGEYDAWLPADYEVIKKDKKIEPVSPKAFNPVDISEFFNCEMTKVHEQEYLSPRPEGYSIGVFANGRYAWEWNHIGHNGVLVDDSALRNSGGVIYTRSGIPFATPEKGENIACVSIWDNFPTEMTFPLEGSGQELAMLFVSTTNAMQTAVENARITVTYEDGSEETKSLIYPDSIDDWMVPALQKENESLYFSKFNHATVQKIRLNPSKKLKNVKVEAVANEVILGVIGISIS